MSRWGDSDLVGTWEQQTARTRQEALALYAGLNPEQQADIPARNPEEALIA